MADELPADTPDAPAAIVTRTVEVDAGPTEVWQAVTDPVERALWLDDPDALARRVRVDESAPGQHLVWTWWHPGDEGEASTVSVVLSPADGGGTRVVVTESLPAASPLGGALGAASASVRSGHLSAAGTAVRAAVGGTAIPGSAIGGTAGTVAGSATAGAARRSLSWVRCACDRWDSRLLGLELLFVAARARVA
jgi:uncharacterized protein YndB with AHSA1/START domain